MSRERKMLTGIINAAGVKTGKPLMPVDEHEAKFIATADSFSASRFMGVGQYELRDFATLDMGLGFLELHPKQQWMLYAIKNSGSPDATKRSVMVTPRVLPRVRELMGVKT